MRMYHPLLPYTKTNGGIEVTDTQYETAWRPAGWKKLAAKPAADPAPDPVEETE